MIGRPPRDDLGALRRTELCRPRRLPRAALAAVVAVVAVVALSSGCTVGPEYKRPEAVVPPAWHEASTTDAGSSPPPPETWWHGFGSAELDGYIDEALRANTDLAAAIARVRQADALARVAGAPLLPSITANAGALDERVQSTSRTYSNFHQGSVGLGASYMIDFWGRNRSAQAAAIATATASRRDQVTVRLTVTTGVATTFFESVELHDRLAVAESNLRTAEAILDGLRRQLKAGIATALDVAQQETTVATLSAAIPPLQEQQRQSVDALAILLGRPPESLEATATGLGELSAPAIAPGLPSEVLARRPDVAEAEQVLIAANANIRVARANFFPSIQLTATGGYASTALSALFNPGSRVFELGAGLTQPIFDGGVLKGQYQYAQARYDELVAGYRKAILSAFSNVEDALVAVRRTREQADRQEVAVAKARRANEFAQAQMRSGTVNILTVLNTETALFSAQDAAVQARFSHFQALVSLYGALGGGWQEDSGT